MEIKCRALIYDGRRPQKCIGNPHWLTSKFHSKKFPTSTQFHTTIWTLISRALMDIFRIYCHQGWTLGRWFPSVRSSLACMSFRRPVPPRVRVAFKWRLGEESRGLTASASFIASRLTVVSFPLFEVQIGWASKSQSQHILSGKVKIKPHSCLKADWTITNYS